MGMVAMAEWESWGTAIAQFALGSPIRWSVGHGTGQAVVEIEGHLGLACLPGHRSLCVWKLVVTKDRESLRAVRTK